MKRFVAAAALASSVALASAASADSDERARATDAFDRAERAGAEIRFGEALAAYREAERIDPTAPFAALAHRRADDLEAHAEGGFLPLAELERMRRDPKKLADRTAVDKLAGDAAAFPDGRVRGEALLVAGESYFHRFGDLDRADKVLLSALDDPHSDRETRGLALSDLVAARRGKGDFANALAAIDAHPGLLPALRVEVARLLRRQHLRALSIGTLAFVAAAALVAVVRLVLRSRDVRDLPKALLRPLPITAALYLGGAGALIASSRDDGDPRPFVIFGLGVAAIVVAARALSLAGSANPIARTLRAAACTAAVAAAAFLAIAGADAGYLASFGL